MMWTCGHVDEAWNHKPNGQCRTCCREQDRVNQRDRAMVWKALTAKERNLLIQGYRPDTWKAP